MLTAIVVAPMPVMVSIAIERTASRERLREQMMDLSAASPPCVSAGQWCRYMSSEEHETT